MSKESIPPSIESTRTQVDESAPPSDGTNNERGDPNNTLQVQEEQDSNPMGLATDFAITLTRNFLPTVLQNANVTRNTSGDGTPRKHSNAEPMRDLDALLSEAIQIIEEATEELRSGRPRERSATRRNSRQSSNTTIDSRRRGRDDAGNVTEQ